jgi:hypothetical protein
VSGPGIALRTQFFRLDWTVRFTRTTVTIDGQAQELPWGEHFYPLEAGRHQLQVSYQHFPWSQAGKASIEVDVDADQVVQVCYRAPTSVLIAYRSGKLRVEPRAES